MSWLEPVTLRGAHAVLEPLSMARHDELCEAVRDGELWRLWYTIVPTPERMTAEIERRLGSLAVGTMVPFTAVEARTGKAAGMTTFMHIDGANRRVEIGSTWCRKSVQRTAFNTECKLLLLRHAFEAKGAIAVELRTHVMNVQSRRAIERLGAKLDGVLRRHMLMPNGTVRDTAVYSITDAEWPTVKAGLEWELARDRGGASGG